MNLPLTGVKVLSAARYLPAGYCTMLLAYSGADIITLEQPPGGIDERIINPDVFAAVNRNKRSFAINLRSDKGREICHELVRRSDVFIEGFRPGVATRLGVDYDTLNSINPKIVYVSISGFGQDGPYRLKSGHDLTYQGIAGMLAGLYSDKEHNFSASLTGLGDICSAMFAAISILSGLYGVKQSGQGQYIDVSMTDGILSWMSVWLTENNQFNAVIQDAGYNI